ncbi:PHD finger protein 20 isoform X4 [Alligator mississippiensis]|uniref:PHD finger protein 20 isoform X4 n=1 Tax=Alligator mississippiensis TaxID=8496 RepID=UPI002877D613|nr:PHD finger protein 20 isoform X4 [Alligator mississippiensis]
MTKHPPNRRGISFEVGAQLEARDRLKNWYPAHIEEIDYEEGKVLIHFKRWNHRYDEWFCWDSPYLRPLEKIQLRKEGLQEDEGCTGFHINDQVLACWSDCRFYPAKVTSVNKDGTYTVKFYDGVVQTVKNIHVKAFSKDQNIVGNARPKERGNEITSSPEKREKFKVQRKAVENAKEDKDEKTLKTEKRCRHSDKEGKLIVFSEKGKVSEKSIPKNGKEDKENISENDMEYSIDTQIEKKPENDNVKIPQEGIKETKRKRGRPPITPPTEQSSQTLQPITLELRRRKIPKIGEVPSKRPRVEKNLAQEKLKSSPDNHERDQIRRRSSRLSSSGSHDILNIDCVTTTLTEIGPLKDSACSLKEPKKVTKTFKRADDFITPKTATVDRDHKFRCKFLDCSKSFRKAKLLHYHMKYFHGIEKTPEPQQSPIKRNIQTRGSLASEKVNQEMSNRRRTTSRSFYGPLHIALRSTPHRGEKVEKRRTSAPSSVNLLNSHRSSLREQSKENRIDRSHRKYQDKERTENVVKDQKKSKEKKSKDCIRSKSKKKKKKKSKPAGREQGKDVSIPLKGSYICLGVSLLVPFRECVPEGTLEYPGSEENIDISQEPSPPKSVNMTRYNSSNKSYTQLSTPPLHDSDCGHHKERLKVNVKKFFPDIQLKPTFKPTSTSSHWSMSEFLQQERKDVLLLLYGSPSDEETLSESSTDSLVWSEDDCSRDIDVTTNPDEDFDEEDSDFEIVRCLCELEEENDFMIQCEECLCWQHGVCMGLLEDNVPEKYTCYICQDPPGQRSSLKYWYEKEWLSNGHMHGLAFLEENYSHQNSKKIVATHQLLGDVQRVIEVLHGLQLKMSILQNKEHPDLKLWCHPWKPFTVGEKTATKRIIHIEEDCYKEETTSYRTFSGTVEKPSTVPSLEESYITSEHCYQKPRAYYPAIEQRLVVETRGSAMDDGTNRIRENGDDALSERFGWDLNREICKLENESRHNYTKVRECVSKKFSSDEAIERKLLEKDKEGIVSSHLQWQLNLLAHVESLQDEVTHRMDFIEKELDVLESWLDYTGELEPPEPLARLPQLKHCIKQLLMDLGKVQQIALCSST